MRSGEVAGISFVLSLLCGMMFCQSFGNCGDGWVSYGSSCYLFADTAPVHFTEAEHYCRQHGGHLVTVESSAEKSFLKTFSQRLTGVDYWMGLTDEIAEGIWKWSNTSSQPKFTDWKPGEPNNDNNQDCARFEKDASGKWDDMWCNYNYLPLCEKSKVIEMSCEPCEIVG